MLIQKWFAGVCWSLREGNRGRSLVHREKNGNGLRWMMMQLIMLQGGCFALGSCERWQVERELIGIQKEDERSSECFQVFWAVFWRQIFCGQFSKATCAGRELPVKVVPGPLLTPRTSASVTRQVDVSCRKGWSSNKGTLL